MSFIDAATIFVSRAATAIFTSDAPRPRVRLCRFARTPRAGKPARLRIRTKHADNVYLRVRQDQGGVLAEGEIPPNAVVTVTPATPEVLRISLTLEARDDVTPQNVVYETCVRPRASAPAFARLEVPRRVLFGDAVTAVWDAPKAGAVVVHSDDGDGPAERQGAAAGVITLHPQRPGRLVLRFTAQGADGTTTKSRIVRVIAGRPCIEVDRPVICGAPGSGVSFAWRIRYAREAWIEAPTRQDREGVALCGGLTVRLGTTAESFRLVAVGHDGRLRSTRLTAVPWFLGGDLDE